MTGIVYLSSNKDLSGLKNYAKIWKQMLNKALPPELMELTVY